METSKPSLLNTDTATKYCYNNNNNNGLFDLAATA